MIKQDWNVSDDDRKRILSLHETATKKNYLIFEQNTSSLLPIKNNQQISNTNSGEKVSEDITIEFNFPTGFHSLKTPGIIDQVTNAFRSLKQFLDKYNNPEVSDVTIVAGESKIRNRDNEDIQSDGKGKPVNPGVLARRRNSTIQNLLTKNFNGLVKSGYLPNIPKFINDIQIGVETKLPEALKEQFVKATFKVIGEKKSEEIPTSECDFNLEFKIEYKYVNSNKNPKFHCCDNAKFTLLLNGVPIKVTRPIEEDPTIFNLNNIKDCGARSQSLYVDSETAKKILEIKEPIDVSFKCQSKGGEVRDGVTGKTGCHEAPMLMTVLKDGKEVEPPRYLGTLKDKTKRMEHLEVRKIATIDKCGIFKSFEKDTISDTGEGDK